MSDLDAEYLEARETAREIVTLIKWAEEQEPDLEDALVRNVVREKVRDNIPRQTWLLVEVLARSVAATYDDLADWSASVIESLADEDGAA